MQRLRKNDEIKTAKPNLNINIFHNDIYKFLELQEVLKERGQTRGELRNSYTASNCKAPEIPIIHSLNNLILESECSFEK